MDIRITSIKTLWWAAQCKNNHKLIRVKGDKLSWVQKCSNFFSFLWWGWGYSHLGFKYLVYKVFEFPQHKLMKLQHLAGTLQSAPEERSKEMETLWIQTTYTTPLTFYTKRWATRPHTSTGRRILSRSSSFYMDPDIKLANTLQEAHRVFAPVSKVVHQR